MILSPEDPTLQQLISSNPNILSLILNYSKDSTVDVDFDSETKELVLTITPPESFAEAPIVELTRLKCINPILHL
jgi:hypothetical protein